MKKKKKKKRRGRKKCPGRNLPGRCPWCIDGPAQEEDKEE